MALKDISQIGHLSLIDGARRAVQAQRDRDAEPVDKISVSESVDVAAAIAAAKASSPASRARVLDAIATAVRQGTYKPDPQRIAESILEDAELIARLQAMIQR
jgi:negative regulator of flagellin synthesis FlgM